jgi:hypothetical protein
MEGARHAVPLFHSTHKLTTTMSRVRLRTSLLRYLRVLLEQEFFQHRSVAAGLIFAVAAQ